MLYGVLGFHMFKYAACKLSEHSVFYVATVFLQKLQSQFSSILPVDDSHIPSK